jgi:hypothetical protein
MKNLQTVIEKIRTEKGWIIDQIADIIGRKRGGYYSGIERKTITIWEFDKLSKALMIEPNDFFEWQKESTNVNTFTNEISDTSSVSNGEVEFLRGQILELNSQIRILNKTIHNLTENK